MVPFGPLRSLRNHASDRHVDPLPAEGDALGDQQAALAGVLGERAVGAHDPVPGHAGIVAREQHAAGEPRGAQVTTGTGSAWPWRSSASYRQGRGVWARAKAVTAGEWVWTTAPIPGRVQVQSEPTENQCDWTAAPSSPVSGSSATIE